VAYRSTSKSHIDYFFMTETTTKSLNNQSLEDFYIEEIADVLAASIAGGAGAKVNANATATGDLTFVGAYAKTYAEQIVGVGSIAFGYGSSMAFGDNPTSSVNVAGTGDRVFGYTTSETGSQMSLSQGLVLAFDRK
jgi:hypothetical protein